MFFFFLIADIFLLIQTSGLFFMWPPIKRATECGKKGKFDANYVDNNCFLIVKIK